MGRRRCQDTKTSNGRVGWWRRAVLVGGDHSCVPLPQRSSCGRGCEPVQKVGDGGGTESTDGSAEFAGLLGSCPG